MKALTAAKNCTVRKISTLLTVIMCLTVFFPLFSAAKPVYASNSTVTATGSNKNFTVTYQFSGKNASRPGYAEGIIQITPLKTSKVAYYILYWADNKAILSDYKPIAIIQATGNTVTYEMVKALAIPEKATKLAVFSSNSQTPSSTALAAAVTIDIPDEKLFDSGKTELRFASLSDIHVNYEYAANKWLNVLNYLKSINIDLICNSGDYTSAGSDLEFKTYIEQIEKSGYTGTIWSSIGNHDTGSSSNYLKYLKNQGNDGKNLYFSKIAENGDLFIFMAQDELSSIGNSSNQECFSKAQIDWVESLLKQYAGTGVNIFIYEHASFRNWGAGDFKPSIYVQPINIRKEYTQTMRLKALLEEYREVIIVSGHTHVAFSEMCNYDDNNGESARFIHNSSPSQIRVANENKTALIYNTNPTDSEGYIVTVYEDDIVYRGMDFNKKLYIPTACYIMESYSDSHEETKDVKSIEVDSSSVSTYYANSLPSKGDIILNVTYTDGRVEAITEGFSTIRYGTYTVSPNEKLSVNDISLLISYGGKWVFFPIAVKTAASAPTVSLKNISTAGGNVVFSADTVKYGDDIAVQISPDEGYSYTELFINGKSIGNPSYYLIENIKSDTEVKAVFKNANSNFDVFTDVTADDWFYDAVEYTYMNNIFSGTSENTFEPETELNRAMLVTLLHRMEGTPETAYSKSFKDVPDGQWFTSGIEWASANGLVLGYDGAYSPTGTLTREQAMLILYRYAQSKGYDVTVSGNLNSYTDVASISDWAANALLWASEKNILYTVGNTLRADEGSTRAEMAYSLMMFIKEYKNKR